MISLVSCTKNSDSSIGKQIQQTAKTVVSKSQKEEELVSFSATDLTLNDDVLSCKIDGVDYKFKLSNNVFIENEIDYSALSKRIIDNPFGISVSANIVCNPQKTTLTECDVIKPNGKYSEGEQNYFFKNCLDNMAEFEYENQAYKVDLSLVDETFCCNLYTVSDEDFTVGGFNFSDTNYMIASDVLPFILEDEYGREYGNEPNNYYSFFATITSVSDESMSALFNDENKEIKVVPSLVRGIDELSVGDCVSVCFTDNRDYFKDSDNKEISWCVVSRADDIDADISIFDTDKIHADYNGESILICSDALYDENGKVISDNSVKYKKVHIDFDNIDYSYKDGKYKTYLVKKAELMDN